jgi:hypothetical protein
MLIYACSSIIGINSFIEQFFTLGNGKMEIRALNFVQIIDRNKQHLVFYR